MRFLIWRLPALAWMAVIFFLSSGPVDPKYTGGLPDYGLHAGAYLTLYLLVYRAVHEGVRPTPGRGGHLLPLLITVLYGLSDEFHQSFVASRDASFWDVVADAAGALLGAAAIGLYLRLSAADSQGRDARSSSDQGRRELL